MDHAPDNNQKPFDHLTTGAHVVWTLHKTLDQVTHNCSQQFDLWPVLQTPVNYCLTDMGPLISPEERKLQLLNVAGGVGQL